MQRRIQNSRKEKKKKKKEKREKKRELSDNISKTAKVSLS